MKGDACVVCPEDETDPSANFTDPNAFICPTGDQSVCEEDAFIPFGGTDTSKCRCRAGHAGVAQPVTSYPGCSQCPADSYCPGGAFVIPCEANAYSIKGSIFFTECTCKDGFAGEPGGACTLCPENSWCFSGKINTCPQNSVAPEGSVLQDACTPLPGYGAEVGMPYMPCLKGYYCIEGRIYACPVGHTSPPMSTNVSKCAPEIGYSQWVNTSDIRRIVSSCNTAQCQVGYYRGPCVDNDKGTCVPCTQALTAAHFTEPGQPFDKNNCAWQCDEGFTRSSQLGVCEALTASSKITIQLKVSFTGDINTWETQKDGLRTALSDSLGLPESEIDVVAFKQDPDDPSKLIADVHVTVTSGTEDTVCENARMNLADEMQRNGMPPGIVLECDIMQSAPPTEKILPSDEGDRNTNDTMMMVGIAVGGAGVVAGAAAGIVLHMRWSRMSKVLPANPLVGINDDPLAALDVGPQAHDWLEKGGFDVQVCPKHPFLLALVPSFSSVFSSLILYIRC